MANCERSYLFHHRIVFFLANTFVLKMVFEHECTSKMLDLAFFEGSVMTHDILKLTNFHQSA